eukprot:Clim_evm69s225 gene=Clim_evmTU69s225
MANAIFAHNARASVKRRTHPPVPPLRLDETYGTNQNQGQHAAACSVSPRDTGKGRVAQSPGWSIPSASRSISTGSEPSVLPSPRRTPSVISQSARSLRIGQYELGETLGVGSFGKVKLAKHAQTQHEVAIKILSKDQIVARDMQQKIQREIQNLKLFRHPHIIKFYEVIATPNDIFMVMEYVNGGELFDYIVANGKMEEQEARKIFQQIVSGVDYCHRHQVVHRDLKPENLLLDHNNNVKIADFGLSCVLEDGNFLKTSCGSPNYAAPEIIAGNAYAGPEVDIWSCGVILYALLCAKLPFDDPYIPNLFKKIRCGQFSIPDHIGSGPRDLLCKMLVVDPLKRATMADVRDHWWFKVDLPENLFPDVLPNSLEPDEDIVTKESILLGVPKEDILIALRNGPANDPLTVAYNLIFDNTHAHGRPSEKPKTHREEMIRRVRKASIASEGGPHSVPASPLRVAPNGNNNLSRSMNDGSRSARRRLDSTSSTSSTSHSGRRHRGRWHLGIRSKNSPQAIMTEILHALKAIDIEWKKIRDPFTIHCRARLPEPVRKGCHADCLAEEEFTYFTLQLYSLRESHYLLDFCAKTTNALNGKDQFGQPVKLMSMDVHVIRFQEVMTQLITELSSG